MVTEVPDRYNLDNSKNNLVVDAEEWKLTINVYMNTYNNHMRNKRQ